VAGGKPIQGAGRSSVLVCDWDNDGLKDVVLADEKGYCVYRNVGSAAEPSLAAAKPITFDGGPVRYARPNLGSFVDWDGDGKKDLIGCEFENSIRLYRNLGSGRPGEEPKLASPQGEVILQSPVPQMISGADAVDWNGDGDIDILTGQGHGASGLRFYERDYLEDELAGKRPLVSVAAVEEATTGRRRTGQAIEGHHAVVLEATAHPLAKRRLPALTCLLRILFHVLYPSQLEAGRP
jgi:hypothetical protein